MRILNYNPGFGGYHVACGWCKTSWRNCAGNKESAKEFLEKHLLNYCSYYKEHKIRDDSND